MERTRRENVGEILRSFEIIEDEAIDIFFAVQENN